MVAVGIVGTGGPSLLKIKDLLKGDAQSMKVIAQDAIELIKNDAMQRGIFQNDKGPFGYTSRQYKIYKNRGMEKIKGGGKLKSYVKRSGSIAPDTSTNWVNMRLSGSTMDGMLSEGKENQAIIAYTKNTDFVLWNAKRDYDIYGLRKKNLNTMANEYSKRILDKNLKRYASKTTIIK